ncbi:MAG: CRISPR-associated helicase Cas3', partial [Bacteroidia bacterium]|nr:CRISPR-associated helicase Cas3' [Bacteroidia bacterium]
MCIRDRLHSQANSPIALLHGDAALYLFQSRRVDEVSAPESHELARHLSHAGIIATGDQVFPYAMRPPGYERVYFALLTGKLIVDEVQAYDPRAAALVVKLLEDIVSFGGKFLLLTATLPPFIREELQRGILAKENIINYYDRLSLDVCRHRVELSPYPSGKLPQALEKVKEIVDKSSFPYRPSSSRKARILVVTNTVSRARELYGRLRKLFPPLSTKSRSTVTSCAVDIRLLHSLFTYHDRQEKESQLRRRWSPLSTEPEEKVEIVVATQVVEAALDIDADYLFTELAPADALVQRMGRIARRFRADDPTVRPP